MPRTAATKATTKAPARAPRRTTAKASSDNVLDILKEDHQKVEKMFKQFEKMKDKAESSEKQALIEKACQELTMHTRVEEEIFYPGLRDAIKDTDLLDEAEVEHATAKNLIHELQAMQPGDELYDAKFTVLGEYVRHHVQEEEKQIFPQAKKAKVDLMGMGEEVRQRKEELRSELGIAGEESAAKPKAATQRRKTVH